MRVLFAQNMIHLPAHGGANKSNRILAELLAAQGHECHVVAPATGVLATAAAGHGGDATDHLTAHGVRSWQRDDTAIEYDLNGVRVHAVLNPSRLARRIRSVVASLRPDHVVVPSDDPAGLVLASALTAAPGRIVYLAYTIQQVPCGPAAFYRSAAHTELIRRAAGALAISRAARDYLRQFAGVDAELIYPPVYGPVPPAAPVDRTAGAVTMINPCGYKGLAVFLRLADAFPHVPFLAVPTWGTTAGDRAELHRRPNIEVGEPADDVDVILRRSRVLLMPSLWDETFGFSCVDAMLRGVPVLASAVGGLVEAKLGVPYVLPVRRIESYDANADRARPVPHLPPQEMAPWRAALHRLLTEPDHHAQLAARSRAAAAAFVAGIDPHALERYLLALSSANPTLAGAEGRR